MKVLFDIGHPAHVHFFKNTIRILLDQGHDISVVTKDKEITIDLLKKYGINHITLGKPGKGLWGKAKALFFFDWKLYKIARAFKPDLSIGVGSPYLGHVSKLIRKPYISFWDTENAKLAIWLTYSFTDIICTPSCFLNNLGNKQVKYTGYKEIAYLHPNYFSPNPNVLKEHGLRPEEKFIIVRFVSWGASHDVGQHGIKDKIRFVKSLENFGRVIISSEGDLPPELKSYLMKISPEKLHDLLSYATLYAGEGATMASEAAVLGTPSIFMSSLAGNFGNLIDLEETYDLLYSFTDTDAALDKAIEILKDKTSKEKWILKRERLLKDKIDVTAFMVWLIENYPKNIEDLRNRAVI